MKTNIKLKPWIGKNYSKSDTKILILGESCYSDEPIKSNFVQELIKEIESGDWTYPFFTKIHTLFSKTEILDNVDKSKFWNQVVFYEYIQEFISGARVRPTKEQWELSEKGFVEVIESTRPDLIFCLGKELYSKIPCLDGEVYSKYKVQYNHKSIESECWKYTFGDKEIFMIGLNHPSSGGFSYVPWVKIINKFIRD
jgi:hypothetical protein